MTGTLIIGDYAHSSWSLRGWLLFEKFGLSPEIRLLDFKESSVATQLQQVRPARTVPTWITPEGTVVWDSLAIAEELAARHPEAGLWPDAPSLRATARSLAAEMHSGFTALRQACPMNLRAAYQGFTPSEAVIADLVRIADLWSFALEASGGPWLCGDYSAADAFFAPVATRVATFDLPLPAPAYDYVAAHLTDPAFRRWRAMGLVRGEHLPWYHFDLPERPWPGPTPRPARAVDEGKPENDACPYSGKSPTYLMECEGRIFGFCNPACRDKIVADPDAWPQVAGWLDGDRAA